MIFESHRHRHRREVMDVGFKAEWRDLVDRRMPQWRVLDEGERARIEDRTVALLADSRWEAAQGFELTEPMQVTIAANASLLVLELPNDAYSEVKAIIIHPSTVVLHGQREIGGGVVSDAPLPIEGEANDRNGPVLISWDAALDEVRHPGRGRNVIHHEFAHKLDMLTGMVDGSPPLQGAVEPSRWVQVCTDAYDAVRDGRSVLDPYAGTNPGEFFAVATETFFATPRRLRDAEADLYDVLADFYAQDPAERVPGAR